MDRKLRHSVLGLAVGCTLAGVNLPLYLSAQESSKGKKQAAELLEEWTFWRSKVKDEAIEDRLSYRQFRTTLTFREAWIKYADKVDIDADERLVESLKDPNAKHNHRIFHGKIGFVSTLLRPECQEATFCRELETHIVWVLLTKSKLEEEPTVILNFYRK